MSHGTVTITLQEHDRLRSVEKELLKCKAENVKEIVITFSVRDRLFDNANRFSLYVSGNIESELEGLLTRFKEDINMVIDNEHNDIIKTREEIKKANIEIKILSNTLNKIPNWIKRVYI